MSHFIKDNYIIKHTQNIPEKYLFLPKCLLGIVAFTLLMLGDAIIGMMYGPKIPCLHEIPQLLGSIGILLLVALAALKMKKVE